LPFKVPESIEQEYAQHRLRVFLKGDLTGEKTPELSFAENAGRVQS